MIAITLPRTLIDKIISGEKKIELRKNYPAREGFIMKVFVVEKGTRNVPITIMVQYMGRRSPMWIWRIHADELGISYGEFLRYAKDSKLLYPWYIYNVSQNSRTFSIDDLDIKKAPQSYVYINKERRNQNERKFV